MEKPYSTHNETEKAILVAVISDKQTPEKAQEYLEELEFLAQTANITTVKSFTQRLESPDNATYIGKGKLEQVIEALEEYEAQYIIFDDDLTPSQVRNLEKYLKCIILDRSLLILEIFKMRAQTAQSKTQVELARLQYILPRLTRMWTHLERQKGGTGTRGGAGEKEIETDRRIIRDQITILKLKLKKIDLQSSTQRKSRSQMTRVALVGYTNTGKSTLMRLISKSNVFAENKLFATVDSTVRKVVLKGIPFLLSDTVGFIRKLPHSLIESFKSTLDEVREADILIHVADISHHSVEDHIKVVNQTLAEIGATNKIQILVLNKIDQYIQLENEMDLGFNESENEIKTLDDLKSGFMAQSDGKTIFISAKNLQNMNELYEAIFEEVKKVHFTIFPNYVMPANDYIFYEQNSLE